MMHAYLILAHNEFDLLKKLIRALDDERNDIFIHIDTKQGGYSADELVACACKSGVKVISQVSVKWGDLSMVKAEYALLHTALDNGKRYEYVHLVSGVDIPLLNQQDMHAFFDANKGKEFLHFACDQLRPIEIARVKYYHFATGRRNYFNRIITKAETTLGNLLKIDRLKGLAVQRGSQWFSITYDFANHLLSQEKFVLKQFKHTFIPDEFFVQTVFINSDFKNNLYHKEYDNSNFGCLRYTDWHRGSPYTFVSDDYDELDKCGCLFARKFATGKDKEICDKMYARIGIE